MIKNRFILLFTAIAMLINIFPVYATFVTEPLYENEYFVQGDFEGASQIPREHDTFGWGMYYSPATAVRSLVTRSADGDEAVYEGEAAIKFANTAASYMRGIYYDPRNMNRTFKKGETVEMSGWFRSDAPGGAQIQFGVGNSGFSDYNITPAVVYSDWTYISARYTFTEDLTNTTGISYASFRINTDVRENYDADPAKSGYVYADNLSLCTVHDVWADDAVLELTANESNALARVHYTYLATDGYDEGAAVVELQTNSADTEDGWTTYKTISNVNENNVSESIVALDSGCAEKYLRAKIQPVSIDGTLGKAGYTDSVFVSKSTNIAKNPELKWIPYGWSGGEYLTADEALKVISEAVYDSEFTVTADTGFNISFDAKGVGDISIYINDSEEPAKIQTLTENFAVVELPVTVSACDSMKLKVKADDAIIDNISIKPQLPGVYGVGIDGNPIGGATVKAKYTYDNTNDGGKAEGDTRVEWYLDGHLSGTGTEFTIPQGTEAKLILKVVPVNEDGVEGNAVETTADVYSVWVDNMKIAADKYQTNGILVPSYSYHGSAEEKDSKLEWVMADSPDAPAEAWEAFEVYNMTFAGRPKAVVTAASAQTDGWIPLSHEQRGKYVAFRITPKDANGREGVPTISAATPLIEFERNLINNGNVSNGTKNFRLWTGAYSNENSTLLGNDDGSGSISANGENTKTAFDTHGSSMPGNGGSDIVQYHPGFMPRGGVKYTLSADMRMDYNENVSMTYSLLFVTSAGYTYQTAKQTNEWGKLSLQFTPAADATSYTYLSVRALGDSTDSAVVKAGKILVDNIECYESLPWVSDLSLSGNPEVGETLTAQYSFNNTSVAEEWNSNCRWLVSDYKWGPWTEYQSDEGTSKDSHNLAVTEDLVGKYIRFEVTPQDMTGTQGLSIQTTNEIFVAPSDPTNVVLSQNEAGSYMAEADFTNGQSSERTIWAIMTGLKTVNGCEQVCDMTISKKVIAPNETANFTLALNDNTAENAKVIFAEGTSFDKLRPISGHTSGSASTSEVNKNHATLNQDKKTVSVLLKSANPNQIALVWALNDSYSAADVTDENYKAAIGYIGLVKTGVQTSGNIDFLMDRLSNGNQIAVRSMFKDGVSYDYSLTYDADATAKIVEGLKNADKTEVDGYLTGVLIDGTVDMAAFLGIDTTEYSKLKDTNSVTEKLAGIDFSGRTSEIRTIVETEAKKQYDYEVWTEKMDGFTAMLQNGTASELRQMINTYNDVLNLNLTGEYGFAIQLGNDADTAFCTELLTALRSRIGTTHEQTLANIRADFDKLVAVAAVNCGPWNKMGDILAAHWSTIGLGNYSKYNDSSYDKTTMYQNIYNQTFTGETADAAILKIKNFVEQQIDALTKKNSNNGNGGTTGGGGSTGGGSTGGGIGRGNQSSTTPDSKGTGWNFSDINSNHWAYEAINKCAEKGIIRGYSDNSYHPDANVTRAEFVTILLRSAGISVEDTFDESFDDVKSSDWYAAAVYTAYDMNIVNGVTENSFAPNSAITREEMSTMVYRLYQDMLKKSGEVSFIDADDFSDWSRTAINALASSGIVLGTDSGAFEPRVTLTRAMAAQIAARLISMER